MLPFKTLLSLQRKSSIPVYRQIAHGLMDLIRSGIMQPGSFLPSSREMAVQLQVHRKTVVAAYEELFSQDWIETMPRKGVRVSPLLPEIRPRTFKSVPKINGYSADAGFSFRRMGPWVAMSPAGSKPRLVLNDGFPDARIAPIEELMKTYRRYFRLTTTERSVMYSDPAGSIRLRDAIAAFLSDSRGLNVERSHVLISSGAQMAIYMAANMLIQNGSTVLVGEPNYPNANFIFQQLGASLIRVPVDEYGIDVDRIDRICRRKKPSLLYIVPHHHHPTTVTLSADRRMKLLQLINTHRLPVIEDDYDYDFHYGKGPILPLATADHGGRVIYVGSLSKCLASSIRVGYMVAPQDFIKEASSLRRMINIRGDILLEEALADLYHSGAMQRHIRKSVKLYRERRDRFCEMLADAMGDKIAFNVPPGGMAAWVRFREEYPLPGIAQEAARLGLFMSDGHFYNSGSVRYNALRMGFASLNEQEMTEIVAILKKLTERTGRLSDS